MYQEYSGHISSYKSMVSEVPTGDVLNREETIKGNFYLPFVGQSRITYVASDLPFNILGNSKQKLKKIV